MSRITPERRKRLVKFFFFVIILGNIAAFAIATTIGQYLGNTLGPMFQFGVFYLIISAVAVLFFRKRIIKIIVKMRTPSYRIATDSVKRFHDKET